MNITIDRLYIFARNDAAAQKKSIIIGSIAIFGGVLVSFLLTALGGGNASYHGAMYRNILLIGGFIIASMAFADIHKKPQGLHYLTLPGSTGERLISRLILVSVAWPVLLTALYSLTTVAGTLIAEPLFGNSPGVFVPGAAIPYSGMLLVINSGHEAETVMTSRDFWETLGILVSGQAVFLFGSIYFKKSAFLKVAVSSFGVFVLFGAFFALIARMVFGANIDEIIKVVNNGDTYSFISSISEKDFTPFVRLMDVFRVIWSFIFYLITPVFFWVLSSIRLRETEV
ncbi:MAG: hypothetical protein ACLFST_10810 [Spirochaetia bacterium]